MELFPDGLLVRLRSRARGTYLCADEDGLGVSLSPRRASPNAEWEVRRVQRGGVTYVLLHGVALGRYLAVSPSPVSPGHRGRRAILRDHDSVDPRDLSWRATKAGDGGGHVVLRHASFNRNLRAAGWGRGVTVDRKKAVTSHWSVEAALPVSPAQPGFPAPGVPRRLVSVRVPRLPAENVTGATLPVLGSGNAFLGYIAAGSVLGLIDIVEGSGDVLRAPERVIKAEIGGGQIPDGLTTLAFLAGRGGGINMIPLLVLEDDAQRNGVGEEGIPPEAAGARGNENGVNGLHKAAVIIQEVAPGADAPRNPGVRDGAATGVHAQRENGVGIEEVRPDAASAGGGEEYRADAVVGAGGNAAAQAVGVDNLAAAHEVAAVGAGAAVLQGGAGADEAGLPVQAVAAAPRNPEFDQLEKFYNGIERKHHQVQELVQELNQIEGGARAAGTRPNRKQTRGVIRAILMALRDYENVKHQADVLLRATEGEAGRPVPPAVLAQDRRSWCQAPCAAG